MTLLGRYSQLSLIRGFFLSALTQPVIPPPACRLIRPSLHSVIPACLMRSPILVIYRVHCGNNIWNRPVFKSSSAVRGAGGGSKEAEDGGPMFSREVSREGEVSQRYHWALGRTGKVSLGVCGCLLVMAQSDVFMQKRGFLSQTVCIVCAHSWALLHSFLFNILLLYSFISHTLLKE